MPSPGDDVRYPPTHAGSRERDQLAAGPIGRQQPDLGVQRTSHRRRLETVEHPQPHQPTSSAHDLDLPVPHGHTTHPEAAPLVAGQVGGVPAQHAAVGCEDTSQALRAAAPPGLLSPQVETVQHAQPPRRGRQTVPPRPPRAYGTPIGAIGARGSGGVRRRPASLAHVSGRSLLRGQDQSDPPGRAEYQEHTHGQHAAPRSRDRGLRAAVGGHPGRHRPTLPQFGSVACGLSTGHPRGSNPYPAAGPVAWAGQPKT